MTIRYWHTTMACKGLGRFFCVLAVLVTFLWGIVARSAFSADDIPAGKIGMAEVIYILQKIAGTRAQ